MTWFSPFSLFSSGRRSHPSSVTARKRRRTRLALEQLEDRLVPSSGLSPDQVFVNQVYVDLTGHPADAPSLATFSGAVQAGLPRPFVVLLIEQTPAYLTAEVDRSFMTFFNRAPSATEQAVGEGFLASGGTELQLGAFLAGSPQFYAASGGNNLGFLENLYKDALGVQNVNDVNYTPAIQQWLAVMDSGVSPTQVAYAILSGSQYLTQQIDSTFNYLGQGPTASQEQALLPLAIEPNTLSYVNAFLLGSDQFFTNAQNPSPPILVTLTNSQVGSGTISFQASVAPAYSANLSGGTMTFTFTPAQSGSPVVVTAPVNGNNLSANASATLTGQNYTLTARYTPTEGNAVLTATYTLPYQDGDDMGTDRQSPIFDPSHTSFDDGNDKFLPFQS